MSLANYVGASSGLYQELKGYLTKEDITALKSELSAMGLVDYMIWFETNQNKVAQVVAATPSERKKKKYDQLPQRRLLFFAGMQLCNMAHTLLAAVHNNGIEPGSSYRDMTVTAGEAAYECFLKLSAHWGSDFWPFDGESPFNEPSL